MPAEPGVRDLAATIRCSIASAGQPVLRRRARAAADAGRPALAGARRTPTTSRSYYGDLRARDAAYHQGTVWAWLIGPFVDAWLKVHPDDRAGARAAASTASIAHLDEACIGSISEIFDAEAPFTPRGCIAQAWSVAEVLRCWLKRGREASA